MPRKRKEKIDVIKSLTFTTTGEEVLVGATKA